jgi:hypothetical protein
MSLNSSPRRRRALRRSTNVSLPGMGLLYAARRMLAPPTEPSVDGAGVPADTGDILCRARLTCTVRLAALT